MTSLSLPAWGEPHLPPLGVLQGLWTSFLLGSWYVLPGYSLKAFLFKDMHLLSALSVWCLAMYYYFPIAAITNYHRLSDLKLHKFTTFIVPKIRSTKFKVSAKLCSFWRLWRIVPLPFPASRGPLYSLAQGPFFHLQSQQDGIFKSFFLFDLCFGHHNSFSNSDLPASLLKGSCDYIGPSQVIQNNLPTWRSLTQSHLQDSLQNVR